MAQTWRLDHSTVLDSDNNPVAIIADPAGDGGEIEWPWVYDEALPESHVQAEANAALIIAAPDLLAALRCVLFGLTDDADNNDGRIDRYALTGIVRDAITKATA